MTDRHAGYIVTLAENTREEDAEAILTAIGMIKGVLSVTPVVGDINLILAQERVRHDLSRKLLEILRTPGDA